MNHLSHMNWECKYHVAFSPKFSVPEIVGYLKGKSALMILDGYANLKYKYGNRHFWCKGYYVDIVGKCETAIREYINNQPKDDIMNDQLSLKEYVYPFTGEPIIGNK